MALGEAEPDLGPWRVVSLAEFAGLVLGAAGTPTGRPAVVAVDGRSSSGKTTLARRLAEAVPGTAVVHTDDVAWWHSCFGWADLLVTGVLEPVHQGEPVAYRPPAWDTRGRPGAIEVPADAPLVVVEGVGAGRREVAHLLDAVVYVQADVELAARRSAARVAAGEATPSVDPRWMAEEIPFVADQRPWERAALVVCGTPDQPHDPATEVVVADPAPLCGMPATEVLAVLDTLTGAGYPRVWVGGGWGVDALVGRQTRSHRDLDLALDVTGRATGAHLDEALQALAGRGYAVETDWLPVRVELAAAGFRRVDLHPVVFDDAGVGWQANVDDLPPFAYPPQAFARGVIAGRAVDCLSVEQQLRFHSGYSPRAHDLHDIALLDVLAHGG